MSIAYNTDGLFTLPPTEGRGEDPLESIECTIAFDVRDWCNDRRSAWIYAIVFGIDNEYGEIDRCKRQFKWDDKDIERVKRLHAKWERLKERKGTDADSK